MTSETKRKIQLGLAVVIAVTGIRAGYIVYQRYSERRKTLRKPTRKPRPLNPDDYVVPKKLYPSDLKSAKELTKQPVWVREGYHHTYYRMTRHDTAQIFRSEAGLLLPLQKLEIKDVVTDTAPHSAHVQQIMAVFEQDGKPFAVSIGTVADKSYSIYSDYYFFIRGSARTLQALATGHVASHRPASGQAWHERTAGGFRLRDGSSRPCQRLHGQDRALSQRRVAGDGHISRRQSNGGQERSVIENVGANWNCY